MREYVTNMSDSIAQTSTAAGETNLPPLRWAWVPFSELSPSDLYDAMSLRQRVFVVEQECAYQDADGRDADAWHLLGRLDAGEGALVSYARVFPEGVRYPEAASIGRIVTAPEVRGTGCGRALMVEALRRCAKLTPGAPIRIAAQRRLENFYKEYGFTAVSDPYYEDGIEHVDMVKRTAGVPG